MAENPNLDCSSHGKVRLDEQGFPHYHYCDPALPLSEEYSKANPWNGASFGPGILANQTPVMPSSEANFYDFSQSLLDGSGINVVLDSGYKVYQTFGPDVDTSTVNVDQTGIFHFNELEGQFTLSGTKDVSADFNIFNPFIYHEDLKTEEKVDIPYVSDYVIATPYYPYPY